MHDCVCECTGEEFPFVGVEGAFALVVDVLALALIVVALFLIGLRPLRVVSGVRLPVPFTVNLFDFSE